MRTENSIKNSITSIFVNVASMLLGFIAQAIFIRILGAEYLGLNGLFSNILTMLSIFELGIGNAIIFKLYKPIANNNKEEIKTLMNFYKKAYYIIAILIGIVGLSLLPFIKNIVGEVTVEINIYIIYVLCLTGTVSSYLLVYKRNLLYADQKNYIINIVHIIYLILLNILQIIMLLITKNYYLYLIIKICCQLFENILLTYISNKTYPFLLEKNIRKLDKKTEKDIFDKVKAIFFHKIGTIIINGTDNIIISHYLGVIVVGFYSNYYMIINAVLTLFGQIITSLTANVGNMLVIEDDIKKIKVFKQIRFLNFWLSCFSAIAILLIIQPFIKQWVGEAYLLDFSVVIALTINYFQKSMRSVYITFKDSAGIWVEDKFIPLIESIINIVASVFFLKIFGLIGVFIGTIVSGLILWCYSYPKFIYKDLLKGSYKNYIKETIGYIFIFCIISLITIAFSKICYVQNNLLQIILNIVICIIIPNLLLFTLFRKTNNYIFFKDIIKNKLSKINHKEKGIIL